MLNQMSLEFDESVNIEQTTSHHLIASPPPPPPPPPTPDKMATILADDIFKSIFLNENDTIPFQISLKFVPRSPVDNNPAWAHVMATIWTNEAPAHWRIYAVLGKYKF